MGGVVVNVVGCVFGLLDIWVLFWLICEVVGCLLWGFKGEGRVWGCCWLVLGWCRWVFC